MNKNLLLVLLLLISFTMQGQIHPGSVLLKGSSAFTGQFFTNTTTTPNSSSETKSSQYNFQPAIGVCMSYFFHMGLFYNYNKQKSETEDTYSRNSSFSIGPYVRVYFTDAKFVPFVQGKIGFSGSKIELKEFSYSDPLELKMVGSTFSFGGGFEYFVSKKFSFDFSFDRFYTSLKNEATGMYSNDGGKIKSKSKGFEFRIGASIILN